MKLSLLALSFGAAAVQAQTLPSTDEQIAAAVQPLPADMRATATVMGYKTKGKLEVIRPGTNGMRCLALYVVRENFHVACYHDGLEAFMLRGRELRDQGMTNAERVDSVRFAEIKEGKLKMPAQGALYSLTGPKTAWDPVTHKVTGATPLAVLYIPFATTQSTGISSTPAPRGSSAPWLMFSGTAKAHVMIVGSM